MIEVAGLSRRFGDRVALSRVDLRVEAGAVVAVLGANGAGKSTLVKCLAGVLVGSGTVRVAGLDPWSQRAAAALRLGVMFAHRGSLWPDLSAAEGLRLSAALYRADRARIEVLADRLGVADRLGALVRTLSLGERVRLELVGALLHRPPVLLFDEPTLGLDPAIRTVVRRVLREAVEDGAALLLTSHDLGEVAQLADRVVVLRDGVVATAGTLAELRARAGGARRIVVTAPGPLDDAVVGADRRLGSDSFELAFDGPSGPVVGALLARLPGGCDLAIRESPLDEVLAPLYSR